MKDTIGSTANLVALDFETTGSIGGWPVDAWQIGMVRIREGRVTTETFESLLQVDADRPIHPMAPGRHHELREEIAAAPRLVELWDTWSEWWQPHPLLAHNIATEKRYVEKTVPLHQPEFWIDSLRLSRAAYPELRSHSLGAVIDSLGLTARVDELCPGREAHDALYDAVACAVLFEHVVALPGWDDLSLEDLTTVSTRAYYQFRKKR